MRPKLFFQPKMLLVAAACVAFSITSVQTVQSTTAPTMDKYTSYPVFINKSVPPDILFILDISEAMLPAAYGYYPESHTDNNKTMYISANVSATAGGNFLCNTNTTGSPVAGCPTPSGTTDTFNSSKEYFGMFNPKRCYTYQNPSFVPARTTDKVSTTPCPNDTEYDGNFLNCLTMRKIDLAKKALVGGNGSSAQCNNSAPFDCNKLFTEPSTGGGGSTSVCNAKNDACYSYVKATTPPAYPSGITSGYYYPAITPKDASNITYFGVMKGNVYASALTDPNSIFFNSASLIGTLQVDLTSETTAVKGEQSTGLFQVMRVDQFRMAVMFTNSGGVAGKVQMYFDQNLTSSVTNNIRNQSIGTNAPLAETMYEALCYYKQTSSPCYNNSPADFQASLGAQNDPYYFCNKASDGNCATPVTGQMVSCCKGYVLMISSGVPTTDGGAPNNPALVPSPMSTNYVGDSWSAAASVVPTQLDDIAYYGKRNDLRGDLANNQNVTFYSVNAMGGAPGGRLLAGASKYGGFEDADGNGLPNSSGQSCTYPSGSVLGTAGSSGTSSSEWDNSPLDCEPDTYFNASEGGDLTTAILAAIQDILKKSASGTAASVLASSSTGEGAVYQAYFYPEDPLSISGSTVRWTGYTTSLFIDSFGNFREDTNQDGRLVYGDDDIVRLRYDQSLGDVMVDRYKDVSPADGIADVPTPYYSKSLATTTMAPLWEAGKKLSSLDVNATCSTAQAGVSCRRIWTWIDTDNDGRIGSTENLVEFTQANATRLAPYLNATASSLTTTGVINFIRGCNGYASGSTCTEQTSLRDRRLKLLDGSTVLWPYGDPINSTPTVVGAPRERYDLIYGDTTYTTFFQRYQHRRQVLYVGSNDGMLHAFNAGFYNKGDNTTPTAPDSKVEHGWFTNDTSNVDGNGMHVPTSGTPRSNPASGAELWAYIPYSLLPQLQWLARTDYTHVYYVDLKPKVTDVRIFTDDGPTGRHPGGWGTILIGGFRFGGSCGKCTTMAPPMTFTANFEGSSADRTFYSGYFVLDITDPEMEPELIAIFTNKNDEGLTTSYPTVVRVNDSSTDKYDPNSTKWYAVIGSGPTGYNGDTSLSQPSQFYAFELKGDKSGQVKNAHSTGDSNAFMGDLIAFDRDLDYRVDAVFGGNTICNYPSASPPATCSGAGGSSTPVWKGKMNRLTTGQGKVTDPNSWGSPTILVQEFSCVMPCVGTTKVGPVTAAPTVTSDDSNNVWVFFGTGRYWDPINDKSNTDTQYFLGVKDFAMNGLCDPSTTDCQQKDLLDVSNAMVCTVCAAGVTQVTGVTGATTFSALVTTVSAKRGWFTTLPNAGERSLSTPTLLGGTLLFTTFIPANDICTITGSGYLYSLFYLSGSAYPEPLIGTTTSGANTYSNRSINLGTGLPSSVSVQLTQQGSGAVGSTGGPAPCSGGLNAVVQSSTAALNQVCGRPAISAWSRYITWMNNRDS